MGLDRYHQKRDFARTPEPRGAVSAEDRRRFVVQEHHASRLHFDLRLEMGGVLKSWSIPKGPSLDPEQRRLAVPTEDHPVEYLEFQGVIPPGSYGAGEHIRWDGGTYELLEGDDPLAALAAGKLRLALDGEKLKGGFSLVKLGGRGQWLLIKARDEHAQPGWELPLIKPDASPPPRKARRKAESDGVKKVRVAAKGAPRAPGEALRAKELAGDLDLRVGGAIVALTSLERVLWPDEGYTKGDLVRYYYQISRYILPYIEDRPLILKRYPAGIRGSSFHQHDVDEVPDYVRTVALENQEGRSIDYVVADNAATSLYLANLGAIERHPWHSRVGSLERPDWLVFDLDPGEGAAFASICELAVVVRDVLARAGLRSYPKTSGSRGIHVYVPLEAVHGYDAVAAFAAQVAAAVAAERPALATVERPLKNRKKGQIYVDHMQNALGKSVVAPYSVRPRPGAPVSAPLGWEEVEGCAFTPRDFTIRTILDRVAERGDLFRPVREDKQRLNDAIGRIAQRSA